MAVHTQIPDRLAKRNAIINAETPITASPIKGISHAAGGAPGVVLPALPINANVMDLPASIRVSTSTIVRFM